MKMWLIGAAVLAVLAAAGGLIKLGSDRATFKAERDTARAQLEDATDRIEVFVNQAELAAVAVVAAQRLRATQAERIAAYEIALENVTTCRVDPDAAADFMRRFGGAGP